MAWWLILNLCAVCNLEMVYAGTEDPSFTLPSALFHLCWTNIHSTGKGGGAHWHCVYRIMSKWKVARWTTWQRAELPLLSGNHNSMGRWNWVLAPLYEMSSFSRGLDKIQGCCPLVWRPCGYSRGPVNCSFSQTGWTQVSTEPTPSANNVENIVTPMWRSVLPVCATL